MTKEQNKNRNHQAEPKTADNPPKFIFPASSLLLITLCLCSSQFQLGTEVGIQNNAGIKDCWHDQRNSFLFRNQFLLAELKCLSDIYLVVVRHTLACLIQTFAHFLSLWLFTLQILNIIHFQLSDKKNILLKKKKRQLPIKTLITLSRAYKPEFFTFLTVFCVFTTPFNQLRKFFREETFTSISVQLHIWALKQKSKMVRHVHRGEHLKSHCIMFNLCLNAGPCSVTAQQLILQ